MRGTLGKDADENEWFRNALGAKSERAFSWASRISWLKVSETSGF
jgi:hypothetical protein